MIGFIVLQERAVQALLVLLKGSPGMILHYQSAGGRETLTAAEMVSSVYDTALLC